MSATAEVSATAERARLAKAQADLAEIKNAQLRGTLLDAIALEAEWSSVLRAVRAGMLAVPSRAGARLPHDVAEIDAECTACSVRSGAALEQVEAGTKELDQHVDELYPMTNKISALQKHLPDVLAYCEAEGMVYPYVVCCVGMNGYLLAIRFAGPGGPSEELAEHIEPALGTTGAGIVPPINIMVTDRNAEAARFTITADKGLTFIGDHTR